MFGGKSVSFSYTEGNQGRIQRNCWMKLEMTAAPAFKLLSAVGIGFDFNALCGKGIGINSIMVAT